MTTDSKKTVSIISNNLSGGGALACLSLSRALQPFYEVQLIGAQFDSEPWSGLKSIEFDYTALRAEPVIPAFLRTMADIRSRITGDLVIAHQHRLASFGIALMHKAIAGKPCAIYIDDDDVGLTMPGRSNPIFSRLRSANGDISTRLMYRLRGRADAVFCGSNYFSEQLGGITVPLGRDRTLYDPASINRREVRQSLDLPIDQTIVAFTGNPRPHVGIEDLVRALELVAPGKCLLVVAPPGNLSDFARKLFDESSAQIKVLPQLPSYKVPRLLAASDIVVIPQRSASFSLGQVPARLVEAMAMAKPIIGTKVGSIPALLESAGIVVDEGSPSKIAEAITWMQLHREEALTLGEQARRIFLEKLTLEAMAERLLPKLESLLARPVRKPIFR